MREEDARGDEATRGPTGGEIRALALDLGRLAREDPRRLAERLAALPVAEQAELALRVPPVERLEILLHAPAPMRLVRALPDAEVYLTVREIGPTDALPLLSLASARQLVHLMDLEGWRRDRFDPDRAGAWVALLLEAGEPTLIRFLRAADDELLAMLFARWVRVAPLETDEDPSVQGAGETEAGTERGFLAPDGAHRFSPSIPEHAAAVRRLAELFFHDRQERYFRTILDALHSLPSELEEMALQWRQSRLEEHGFPPWDEALDVYAPPERGAAPPAAPEPAEPGALASPRTALRVLDERGVLARATDLLSGDVRERLLFEIASLANHLLVADAADTGDPDMHRAALEKAAAYVGIALEGRGATEPAAAAAIFGSEPLLELFREGHARSAALGARASHLVRKGWASVHPRALDLLDPPIRPRVTGLLRPRPLYFDLRAAEREGPYRDFRRLEEIEETRLALDLAEILGRVFVEGLGLDVPAVLRRASADATEPTRFSTLFLTALAWHASRGELGAAPLPPSEASRFVREVASRRTADPDAPGRALDGLLDRLSRELRLTPRDATALAAFGRACLTRLAEECGGLDPGAPVDPRHVSCLLLEGSPGR